MGKKDNSVVQEKKKKSKKPLLIIGLVLLALTLAVGLGWVLTGSFVLLRNSIYLTAIAGAGIGVGAPIANKISKAIATKKANKSKQRNRNRDRNRDNTLEAIPTQENAKSLGRSSEGPVVVGRSSTSQRNR